MKNKLFSLIELITVIVVILVLMTLFVPTFERIKTKAKTALCANQLKQLGTLISVYALDNDGYLPNSGRYSYTDLKIRKTWNERQTLYDAWTGHLLPYFNLELKSYARNGVYYSETGGYLRKPSEADNDPMFQNYQLVKEMLYDGGYGSLKLMVCPEATATPDALALVRGDDRSRVSSCGMERYSNSREYGLPSSYLANGTLFGYNGGYHDPKNQTSRLEDVFSETLLIAEGSNYGSMYAPSLTFYTAPINNAYGFAGTFSMRCLYGGSNSISGSNVLFSYMHDDTREIWVSDFARGFSPSFVKKFNAAYNPIAAASKDLGAPEHGFGKLATSEYPGENWEKYSEIIGTNKFKIDILHTEDSRKDYFFGNTNILRGDLSVSNKNIGWLYENHRELTR